MLLFIAVVIIYSAVVGLLQPVFAKELAARCSNCASGQIYTLYTSDRYGRPSDRYGRSNPKEMEPGNGHGGSGAFAAAFWPVTAPYILANAITSESTRRGRRAIDNYWKDKDSVENQKRLERLEREVGL